MNEGIFDLRDPSYLEDYGNKPFLFKHNLQDEQALTINNIRDLALRLPKGHVFYSSGNLELSDDFDNAHSIKPTGLSLQETLENMELSGSYMYIRQPEVDPEYKPIFEHMVREVEKFKGTKDPGMRDAMLYMFIASPNSITPFHVDRYETLLTQITGRKTIKVWAPNDHKVVTESELDSLFAKDKKTEPKYREENAALGDDFEMEPGDALHIPFTAPHCVQTGPEVSIGLSIIFTTNASMRRSMVHQFNYKLRKLRNVEPTPVGKSAILDRGKFMIYSAKQKMFSLMQKP